MKTPNLPEGIPTSSTSDALPEAQTGEIAAAVKALLQHGTIKDATDRRIIAEAAAFIEVPTGNLSDITKHASNIGEVLGGYMMQGTEAPPQVDAMHGHFIALQCQHHIGSVKEELKHASPDFQKIQHWMLLAFDVAKILLNGYKDGRPLKEVQELQQNIGLL